MSSYVPHPPLAFFVWEDAGLKDIGPWVDDQDHSYKPKLFAQTGFILKDDPAGIVVTAAWSPDLVATREQIPRGMIRHFEYLTPKLKPPRGRKGT